MNMRAVLLVGVLATSAVAAENPFADFTAEDIATVLVGTTRSSDDGTHFQEYFSITNRITIADLHREAEETHLTPDLITMAGTLSHQRFLDRQGQVLAEVRIILSNAEVVFRSREKAVGVGHNAAYCRTIYDLMNQNCTEVVSKMDEFFRTQGPQQPLTALLFGEHNQTEPER